MQWGFRLSNVSRHGSRRPEEHSANADCTEDVATPASGAQRVPIWRFEAFVMLFARNVLDDSRAASCLTVTTLCVNRE